MGMGPKYEVGQKVVVKSVKDQSARDSEIGKWAGLEGTVSKYYWIRPMGGQMFYIYTVQFGDGRDEIVLHEDEIEAFIQ